MARPLRLQWEGAWYHVTSRGNERRLIFRDDEDRSELLGRVSEMTERYRLRVHAYTLMDNHWHGLLETLEANLSRAMQWLNSGYSAWFNRRHGRTGHLLEGRFKGIIVEPQRWGLELSRYVHLNPIRVERFDLDKQSQRRNRAGLGRSLPTESWRDRIEFLRNYRWSSYRAYIGLELAPEWLTTNTVLSWLGGEEEEQRGAYREYVEKAAREGLKHVPWDKLQAQVVLGDEAFLQRVSDRAHGDEHEQPSLHQLKRRPEFAVVVGVVERMKGERWNQFSNRYADWGRDLVLFLARHYCGMTLGELGRKAGRIDAWALSKALHRFEARLKEDPQLARRLAQANSQLSNCPDLTP
jgi:REP-associated tyrosine transposase